MFGKETNEDRRRRLREDLDNARRDERRPQAEREIVSKLGKQRIEQRRLQGGSRFNIRFEALPSQDQLTPEAVKKALSEYVEFGD
jgi:hypothetical protein